MNNESLAQRPRLSEGDSRVLLAFHVGLVVVLFALAVSWWQTPREARYVRRAMRWELKKGERCAIWQSKLAKVSP